eukprot:TRINITY_DN4660_c0_g1_i9.p1 TRINITY_DN4660_c0_g1~~TRINITY_DN4660_c0_g1_i9.p1  ORF type:complete len:1066 (-),score=260.84 TRINITY_DN4660_c0_g1_i9:458-3655(-)
MDRLLNFAEAFDVNLLEEVVLAVYGEDNNKRNLAQSLLTQLKEHPQSWTRVDTILEHARNDATKFFALQILDNLIRYRWKILPQEQREGIRNYVIGLVLKLSSSDPLLHTNRLVLEKLNLNLVQILKHDWPTNWKTFIPEITSASKTNECICENNMRILKTLSEEVFDFSKGEMTQVKIKQLKESLNSEFFVIYQLCEFVMTNSQKPKLLLVTLETLLKYLSWIPIGYIFETSLLHTLLDKFFEVPVFRNVTLQCLTEIAQLQIGELHNDLFVQIYVKFMQSLYKIVPTATDFRVAFNKGTEEERNFIQDLAIFLGAFFTNHVKALEKASITPMILDGHYYLVKISNVEDIEIFRICLDYWYQLASTLYQEAPVACPLLLDNRSPGGGGGGNQRRVIYEPVLSKVREVVISRMAKPEEVIVVEDENGNIVKEVRKDGEQVTRYKIMKSLLVFLTHLNYEDTQNIMLEKLASQVDGSQFHWNKLNTLCWAIGSIADTQSEVREKRFLVIVIKDLLTLCEVMRGKDNKAVIASNIMYVVGQYPRFLRAHWKFLTTVVNKLFEFMHETHPGVQDMACDTLLKIVTKCKAKFSVVQEGETEPFTLVVIKNIPATVSELNESQIQSFYESVGHMVNGHKPQDMEFVVGKLMELPNSTWFEIMNQAKKNPLVLREAQVVKKLANILKINVRACSSVGPGFISQIARLYFDVLGCHKFYSSEISREIQTKGGSATRHAVVKEMRSVKREALKFITTFIGVASEAGTIVKNFLPPLLPSVLEDYQTSVPEARDQEVLSLLAAIVSKCGVHVTEEIPKIFGAIFECTLKMISNNFEDFIEIRLEFFLFLLEVCRNCFVALKRLQLEHFKLVVDSIVWAFKHTMRNISEIGLQMLLELLQQINNDNSQVANSFYQSYFLYLLQDLFYILTDTFHKSGFKLQAQILLQMFMMVEEGRVVAPLWNPSQVSDPTMDNRRFIREYVMNLLSKSFANLTMHQVTAFVVGLFDLRKDFMKFCTHLRDFLVELKEFSGGDDNSHLFSHEQETERERVLQQELSVPGLVGPHDPRRGNENMTE